MAKITYYWLIKYSYYNSVTYLASRTEPIVKYGENGEIVDISYTQFTYPVFGSQLISKPDWVNARNISVEIKRPTKAEVELWEEVSKSSNKTPYVDGGFEF